MTHYTQTIAKSKQKPQTGILPALPALGSIGSSLLSAGSTILSGAGIASLLSKAKGFLPGIKSAVKTGASKGKTFLGGGTAATLAKGTGVTLLLTKVNDIFAAGGSIGGVQIIPAAIVAGSSFFTLKNLTSNNPDPLIALPVAGVGLLAGISQL